MRGHDVLVKQFLDDSKATYDEFGDVVLRKYFSIDELTRDLLQLLAEVAADAQSKCADLRHQSVSQ